MSRYYKTKDVEIALVFSGLCDGKACGEIKKVLNSIPTIGIVQCFECKRWRNCDGTYGICYSHNDCNTRHTKADDFCSYGERKDNG